MADMSDTNVRDNLPTPEENGAPGEAAEKEPSAPEANDTHGNDDADFVTAAAEPTKREPRRPLRFAKPLSFILALLMVFALLAATMFGVLRTTLSKEGLANIVSELDIGALFSGLGSGSTSVKDEAAVPGGYVLASTETGNFVIDESAVDLEAIARGETDALADYIYDVCGEEVLAENNITRDSLGEILERSNVSDFVTRKFSDTADNFLKTGNITGINSGMIVELIRENESIIEEVTGKRLTEEQYAKMGDKLDENSFSIEITSEDIKSITGVDTSTVTTAISTAISPVGYISAIASAAVLALLILALHRFLIGRSLPYIAVPALISGILLFAVSALLHVGGGLVMDGAFSGVIAVINTTIIIRAAAFAVSGVVLMIAAVPLKRFNI